MWKQNLTNEEYHGDFRNYLSSSDLRRILRSPAHYRAPHPQTTAAQEVGTLVHEAVLEPSTWQICRRPAPKIDKRTKEGKATFEWQTAQEQQLGIKFVPEDLYNQVCAIAESVASLLGPTCLFTCGMAEVSGFTELNDQPIRIRPDYIRDEMIIDLKTTVDARDFQRSVFNYGYDIQAALYLDAAKAIDGLERKFVWVVVEKEAPYGVQVFEASDEVIQRGRSLYQKAIQIYQDCAALDVWPSYSTAIQTLELPKWLKE